MSGKQRVYNVMDKLPDEVSFQEIVETLQLRLAVEEGIQDHEDGRVVSNEEMQQKFDQWLRP